MLKCRDMRSGEEPEVLALVMRGFDEFVRPDFSEEGIAEFARSARSFVVERPAGHAITVAESEDGLLGMIDLRDGSHVSLFFVEAAHQRRGVGGALLDAAISRHPEAVAITVNSGPSAASAYRALGFTEVAAEAEVNGIRYVAMRKELATRGQQAHQPDKPAVSGVLCGEARKAGLPAARTTLAEHNQRAGCQDQKAC